MVPCVSADRATRVASGEIAFQVSRTVSCSSLPDDDVHYLVTVSVPFAPGWFGVDALCRAKKVLLFRFKQICRSMLERESCCQLDRGCARFCDPRFRSYHSLI